MLQVTPLTQKEVTFFLKSEHFLFIFIATLRFQEKFLQVFALSSQFQMLYEYLVKTQECSFRKNVTLLCLSSVYHIYSLLFLRIDLTAS